ncbi:MAG: type II secretion system F family protein [Rhodobiaceae bacterium]|nr:type II secretion system F family protein [Rhodobiaceae bacterium]
MAEAAVFSPQLVQLALFAMVAIAIGGVGYVFLSPFLTGERRGTKRLNSVAHQAPAGAQRGKAIDQASKKKQVQESLKELEDKRKKLKKRLTLKQIIAQAGYDFSLRTYFIASAIFGFLVALILLLATGKLVVALTGAFAAGIGVPRWVMNFLRKRRQKKFLDEFPNSIDVIVRGVKAGLPLNDTIRVIASESAEPVRSEFREVVEAQAFGLPVGEGLERMYERMPLAEVNFLSIVIAIQSQAGGNLAEALSNLSKVLRDRKRLAGKIQAMSQEAKASAAIIAALPLTVMLLVYITTPAYIALLWQEQLGHMMLAGSALWMTTGVLVMRKMINFDF